MKTEQKNQLIFWLGEKITTQHLDEIERLKTTEQQAIDWAKLAGKNQKQIEKLADEIEGLTSELACINDILKQVQAERDELKEDLERERMRLAACGVAALANTEETIKQRLDKGNQYYSASYGDVCDAVDREMELRERLKGIEELDNNWKEIEYPDGDEWVDFWYEAKEAIRACRCLMKACEQP